MPNPVSVGDPGGVTKAYASCSRKRGGRFEQADARSWHRRAAAGRSERASGPIRPAPKSWWRWGPGQTISCVRSATASARHQARLSHAFQGARQRHAQPPGARRRDGYVLDTDDGRHPPHDRCRVRAARCPADAACSSRVEPLARAIFPLGERARPGAWLGRRPCLPDMLPIIGARPRHAGCGSTSATITWASRWAPLTGRLLAEMMTGEATFTDPSPYRAGGSKPQVLLALAPLQIAPQNRTHGPLQADWGPCHMPPTSRHALISCSRRSCQASKQRASSTSVQAIASRRGDMASAPAAEAVAPGGKRTRVRQRGGLIDRACNRAGNTLAAAVPSVGEPKHRVGERLASRRHGKHDVAIERGVHGIDGAGETRSGPLRRAAWLPPW